MSHHLLLILHLICATIWIGGHLYLSICLLPKILRRKDVALLLSYEKSFEPLGMSALLLLVITGVWMALQYGVSISQWFSFSSPIERVVSVKLILLFITILFALSVQIRVLPKLRNNNIRKLPEMAFHIIAVTIIGIVMLILGTFVRYGGI